MFRCFFNALLTLTKARKAASGCTVVAGSRAAREPPHLSGAAIRAGAAAASASAAPWQPPGPCWVARDFIQHRFLWSLVRRKLLMSYFSFSLWNRAQGRFLLALRVGVLVTAVINIEVLILLMSKNSCWKKENMLFCS